VNRTFSGGTIFLALQLSIAPGYQDTWERVLVSLMDISELRMAEERIRRYARRIEVFRDLDQAILATHSLTEVIHLALDRLLELVPARSALLLQKEADGEALSILYARPPEVLSPGDLSRMKLEFSWFKDQTSPDSSGVAISPLPPEAMPSGKDSAEVIALSVPLSYPEDLPGLLCVCLPVDQPLYDDYRVSVREIAGQISIALRQADLSEQVRDYTQKLEDRVEQRTTELRAANQQLRELTRIKDEFVGNVSHELRTPITSLKLYHHLLELNPDRWMDYRMVLRRETARLEHLIEGLLLLSRQDQDRVALTLQTVNLGKLAADLTEDRRAVIEAQGLTLITDLEAAVPPAYGDPKLIEQVISILLTNAINYTPAGGEVRVLCRGRDEDHRVGITVSDTGRGIPPEDLKSVFERFYRGLAARETNRAGTGLGLAIAREIVERHQGEIEITSPGIPGQGTVCTVWFPTTNGTG
jgi:signal transduction histidine kinase